MQKVATALVEYLEKTGIKKTWFADQLGMHIKYFYQITQGKFPVPRQYWKKMIELTKGEIPLSCFLSDCLNHDEILDVESLQVDKCIVKIRKDIRKEIL